MDINSYINKWYYDSNSKKYFATSILSYDERSVLLLTEHKEIIKICYGIKGQEEYKKRIKLMLEIFEKNQKLLFDKKINISNIESEIEGLKSSEYGYIFNTDKETSLNFFINCPKDEKLFKWYFNKTGGISSRLKIAYCLGCELKKINELGFLTTTISPDKILIKKYNESRFDPNIEFAGIENLSSKNIKQDNVGVDLYYDPLVYNGFKFNSCSSDTYSFAVLFFKLLTTLHPFVGNECENLSEEEILYKVNSGNLNYIGLVDNNKNTNNDFEDLKIFISNKILELFKKMFVDGKLKETKRPSLDDFLDAILESLARLKKCENCNYEYNYNEMKNTCPLCDEKEHIAKIEIYKLTKRNINNKVTEKKELISRAVLQEGVNKIFKRSIDQDVSMLDNFVVVTVDYSKNGKLIIANRFEKQPIYVFGSPIPAKFQKDCSRDFFKSNNLKIGIMFSNLRSEKYEKFRDEVHGEISIRYEIIIK